MKNNINEVEEIEEHEPTPGISAGAMDFEFNTNLIIKLAVPTSKEPREVKMTLLKSRGKKI